MSEQSKLEQERDRLAHAHRSRSDVYNEDWNSFNSFKAGFDAATEIHQERIARLREALDGLLYYWTNTPCRFDLNGNCQAHSCFGYDKTCSVADARAALQEDGK